MMGGERWVSNVVWTSTLLPGIVFAIFFVMNLVSVPWASRPCVAISGAFTVAKIVVSLPIFSSSLNSCFGVKGRRLPSPLAP